MFLFSIIGVGATVAAAFGAGAVFGSVITFDALADSIVKVENHEEVGTLDHTVLKVFYDTVEGYRTKQHVSDDPTYFSHQEKFS